ncbi:DUF4350 domain-containing protein [Winogradskyella alexanderae]|uniref:DUF4350 domain-containing protein n=1 Tax=Winogradskyella alexanderae TaxID=2877123 RepID=A0ABS7XQM9_9FLAO|nr:DUF4350 domain-containing protein [Winogradskyella alexanderae]MCA0132305.1 DUF4350 domain-containing protein [Winogradskyella alexanderae]
MSIKGKIYIALVLITILSIVVLEMTKPKELNWFPSYAIHHKIPFGSIVFKDQLQRLADSLNLVERPPFEFLKNDSVNGSYLFYNGGINFGEDELERILNWVDKGNTLLVAATDFEKALLDTLHLRTKSVNTVDNFNNEYQVQLVNPYLNNSVAYKFDRPNTFFHFNKIDTSQTQVLGFIDKFHGENKTVQDSLINIIKQPFGEGQIILSTFPQAFTNYFILNSPNQNYTAGLLSYLNMTEPIFLDRYYKDGKKFYTSPMYLFLNTKSLKWAYYTVLVGVLIYILFEGKRKQRAIPVAKQLTNQTVAFTRTISNMYYENGKHKDIAHHKIQHFLEYIRNSHYLNTSELNEAFIKNLASRSNNSIEDTRALFNYMNNLNKKSQINTIELERLNTLIENFKSHNQWKTKK